MYFLRRLRPLEVAGERVRSLRLSLNAPVLSASDLPVGPARAAIVVHRDPRGRMDVTVGARSLRGGEVAYWSFDGDLESEDDLDVASDAALTFAESLGFLFDEAPLGGGAAAEKAFRAWLGGDDPGATSLATRGGRDASFDGAGLDADLLLDDAILEEPAPARPEPRAPAAAPPPIAPPPPVAPPAAKPSPPALPRSGMTLSKFRARDAEPDAAPAAPAAPAARPARKVPLRQPLARVQLVKRRSPEEERKLLLRRLLTSF